MNNKNIVVIGGNSGIGKSITEKLEIVGANIFVYHRSGEGTEQPNLKPLRDFRR
jgi:NAD(P)-dependent dehydrogenase (short-subunit alcohol dehydrogenase family)